VVIIHFKHSAGRNYEYRVSYRSYWEEEEEKEEEGEGEEE